MIYTELDTMIATARKEQNTVAYGTLKLVKAGLVKAEKDGVEINDANETKILYKMIAEREDSIRQFTECGASERAKAEAEELAIIKALVPEQPSEEQINQFVKDTISTYAAEQGEGFKLSMKDMKPILTKVQATYPAVNGKTVSTILQSMFK